MKNRLLLFFCLFITSQLLSQDFNDYQPLKNQGQLPADFTVLPSVKYSKDLKKIKDDDKRKVRKTKKNFYLNSNFAIDGLLKSGKVLYETEHSSYLKEIIKLLLKDKPELSNKIRVYLLRTPSVNAFATADGIVFVTMGLLAQVENEAQLAYVLSHEIVHVDKKHALELALESIKDAKVNDRQKLSRNGEVNDKSLSKNLFTQDQELEADREGYKLFAKTNYSSKNINRVFDVLKYSELPFDDIPFERSFLETDYLKIPNQYFAEKVKAIEGINEKVDDKHSSHPNLFKRRSEINALLVGQKDEGKIEFVISKERFDKLQKVSRFEIPQVELHQQLFQSAIYNAFLLKKTANAEQYPEIVTAKALYGLAKYKNNEDIEATAEVIKLDSIEGEGQQVYHLFDKMPNKELTVLATSYAWRTAKKYKKNTDLKDMAIDLLWILADEHNMSSNDFLKNMPPPLSIKPKETVKDSSQMTKIDKIKKEETDGEKEWWKYAFVECLKDEEFAKAFDKMAKRKKEKEIEMNVKKKGKKAKTKEDELAESREKGFYLGIPKIVVVNPGYIKLTQTLALKSQKMNINLIESEKNIARFEQLMKDNASAVGINMTMLNSLEFKKDDVQRFNDYTLLKDWYYEQSDAGNMVISGYRQKEIEELAKKYDTDYFMWTGVIGLKNKRSTGMKVIGAMMLPTFVMTPFGILLLADINQMYYYSILYNVKTGKNYIIKSEEFMKKDSDMLLNAHIYDALLQIKTKKETSK